MKKTLRLLSLVLSLVMLSSFAAVSVSSEDADIAEREQYQHVTYFGRTLDDSNILAVSDEGFVVDNVVYNQNGNKVREIPVISSGGSSANVIIYLDGRYGYTYYMDAYHDENWSGTQLMNVFTGEFLVNYQNYYTTDWEHRYYTSGGKVFKDGKQVADFAEADGVAHIGGGMFVYLTRYDREGVGAIDSEFRCLYDINNKSGDVELVMDFATVPCAFFDGLDNGWAYTIKDDEYSFFMIDRKGNKINEEVYDDLYFDSNYDDIYMAYKGDTELILDNSGKVLCTLPREEMFLDAYEGYIVTVDEDNVYRVYNRNDYTTDGATYGWFCRLGENSFTVGDGTFDVSLDTPDLIYNADGSITETELNSLMPLRKGAYLAAFDYETEDHNVYDLEFNLVYTHSDEYLNIFIYEYDDILVAQKKNGNHELVKYDGTVLSREYDESFTMHQMQRFSNGNLLVVVGYKVDGQQKYDVYIVSYHDTQYMDVKNGSWYVEAVRYASENGIMNGMSDTSFAPDESMTRAQLVTVLYRMAGTPEVEFTNRFSDVKKETLWYAPAVMWAAENGIVEGFPDGTFAPNEPITRDQLAAILYRYTEFMGGDTSAKGDMSAFSDGDKIQKWARPAVEWAVGAGIINGKPHKDGVEVAPKAFTTRAEVATVIMRYLSE